MEDNIKVRNWTWRLELG